MSIQFGKWNFDGGPTALNYLEKVQKELTPYGLDGTGCYSNTGMTIFYGAFHTTKESHREKQPHISESGAVITWDGRLDNRADLIFQLRETLLSKSADILIVAAAYRRWGTDCFAKLIGDWAVSIWEPSEYSLILARDSIGIRHLYYLVDGKYVTWCTILDPLVLHSGRAFPLEEEYLAGWFSFFPAANLTPYVGIHSVPPSSFVRLGKNGHAVRKYWDFECGKKIRYRTDSEYEEHFRTAFMESVKRRLRSDSPVLAELSGGMDSSAVVCMADKIIARDEAEASRLDTISYYDDSEPNWNERPYFTKVEEQRGRTGCHIDLSSHESLNLNFSDDRFAATPALGGCRNRTATQFAAYIVSQGTRVVLAGIGGDEVTGGVPTPTPELADLLARARFRILAHQLKAWALDKRRPWTYLLFEAAQEFFPASLQVLPKNQQPPPWLYPSFVKNHRSTLDGYESRFKLFGSLPSFQANLFVLEALRRQLTCAALPLDPPYEKRYPYLDRDLLQFLYSVPREQLVRPGQRRSLMRRALTGIVPDELLNRKRKAFVVRAPMAAISAERSSLVELSQDMLSSFLKIVDPRIFREEVEKAHTGQEVNLVAMLRTIGVELWLHHLRNRGVLQLQASIASDVKLHRVRNAPAN